MNTRPARVAALAACFAFALSGCVSTLQNPRASAPPESVETAALGAACARGDVPVCDGYGVALLRAHGAVPDVMERATAALQRACEARVPGACAHLAQALLDALPPWRDVERARTLSDRACALGDGDACLVLGLGVETGRFGPRDATRAASLYDRACEAGSASGCGVLGYVYFNGVGVARDRPRALALFQRGCDGGDDTACALGARADCVEHRETACAGAVVTLARLCDRRVAEACLTLATQHGEGFGTPRDPTLSTTYAARACELGVARGCELVAEAQLSGEGAPLDLPRAVSSLTEICARDESSQTQSCSELGFLHHLGRGVAQDDARAAALYERACEHLDGQGCALLGWSFEEGLHAPRDLARAAALYQRGCDETLLGAHLACVHLGNALSSGRGVEPNMARAVAAYERACELGDPVGCQNLAEHLLSGEGIAPNAERARALLHRACAGGGAKSCVLATLLDVVPVSFAGARATLAAEADAGCARGEGVACVTAAFARAMGHGVTVDASRAADALRRACEAGVTAACPTVDAMRRVAAEQSQNAPEVPLGR